ncbi:hypothetical protein SAMN02745857_00847 [Andreprevotia lacus DSM 23236]|jgi:hypothetical protein|uniref:DUF4304 domain-containing protein n=1 Tax=Andreprevotia lacus DSM 23236 TaxID=1121001 RepID=A0A1W1X8M2_9NEIS|nr:hypothetical protein [Andreprevotia lacus]SMC20174.1 hypothetical protein SAMN02745857_00847 [Andreprevotia lacus DSM 23236]
MAQKSVFSKFIDEFKKHAKLYYPFVQPLKVAVDPSLPKNASFYLGISPVFGRHVILNFHHAQQPWRFGMFTIFAHISDEYNVAKSFDTFEEEYEQFLEGMYDLPNVALGKEKYWLLKELPDEKEDRLTELWCAENYENEAVVLEEAVKDVSTLLERTLFLKGGFT